MLASPVVRDYGAAIAALNSLQRRGVAGAKQQGGKHITPRQKMAEWLDYLRLDIAKTRYIHVAGTKGKGTTCLYTEDILRTYYRRSGIPAIIGCLTSPHVSTVRERIRLNSRPVSEDCFAAHFWPLWERVRNAASGPPMLSYPGFIVLLALRIFNEERVNVAVLETGMGGETDSTNVIANPVVTGITEIGFDHEDRLGNTIESIAWYKSGIIKQRVPAFSVGQVVAAQQVLKARAAEKCTQVQFIDDNTLTENNIIVQPDVPFQRSNAALAIALAGTFIRHTSPDRCLDLADMQCVQSTPLPAKFEMITKDKLCWVLSSAHNTMSVQAACHAFRELLHQQPDTPAVLLFSHDSRRDSQALLQAIHTELNHVRPFRAAIFCADVMDESEQQNLDLKDFRRSPDTFPAVLSQHRATWEGLQANADIQTFAEVCSAVRYIEKLDFEALIFVVGSSYLGGMARSVISPREEGLD